MTLFRALTLSIFVSSSAFAADDYVPGPDSKPQPGVPKGEVIKLEFKGSKIFPGTVRDYWIYVPAQFVWSYHIEADGASSPTITCACLMGSWKAEPMA